MTSDPLWWREKKGGRTAGPFTRLEILQMLESGEVAPHERIWSAGARKWRPAADLRTEDPRSRRARPVSWAVAILASLLYWPLLAVIVVLLVDPFGLELPTRRIGWVWPALGVGLLADAAVGTLAWWRLASGMPDNPERAGLIRIASIFLVLMAGAGAYLNLRSADFMARGAVEVEPWTYVISPNKARTSLMVDGHLGPRFAKAFTGALGGLKDPATIEIASLGGLVDQAMIAAAAIEKRPDATLIVREYCISACTILLMSARHRLADYDAAIALHAVDTLVETKSRFFRWSAKSIAKETDAFLRAHGVGQTYIDAANAAGPDKLELISAPDALDAGILTGLLIGDAPITSAQARKLLETEAPAD